MTNLVKKPLGLEWRGGNNLIASCKDQNALRIILSEGLYEAISLYTRDTPEKNVKIMLPELLEHYKYEPVSVFINAINKIKRGERKIFGLVTPHDMKELIEEELNEIAIARENKPAENKGYGTSSTDPRTSSRWQD